MSAAYFIRLNSTWLIKKVKQTTFYQNDKDYEIYKNKMCSPCYFSVRKRCAVFTYLLVKQFKLNQQYHIYISYKTLSRAKPYCPFHHRKI